MIMKRVIFNYETENGLTKYPDDISLFGNTDSETIPGKIIADYSGAMSLTEYTKPVLKSVYTISEFIEKIPPNKLKAIRASTNDTIDQWVFLVPTEQTIDLNNNKPWFLAGLAAMVTEGIFTQNQVNNFLEI